MYMWMWINVECRDLLHVCARANGVCERRDNEGNETIKASRVQILIHRTRGRGATRGSIARVATRNCASGRTRATPDARAARAHCETRAARRTYQHSSVSLITPRIGLMSTTRLELKTAKRRGEERRGEERRGEKRRGNRDSGA